MIPLRPLADRVAVRPLAGTGKIGDILIPDVTSSTRNQTFTRAEVLAAGPDVRLAKAGMTVIMSEYFGDEIETPPESQRVGRERDLVAVETLAGLYPVGDRLLFEEIKAEEEIRDGIIIPQNVTIQQHRAKVVAVGIDVKDVPIGAVALVPKNLCVVVRLDGKTYLLIDEPALLALL